ASHQFYRCLPHHSPKNAVEVEGGKAGASCELLKIERPVEVGCDRSKRLTHGKHVKGAGVWLHPSFNLNVTLHACLTSLADLNVNDQRAGIALTWGSAAKG